MPGPDDTLKFLKRYAEREGFSLPEDLDPRTLAVLREEAERLREGERALRTLLSLHVGKTTPDTSSILHIKV